MHSIVPGAPIHRPSQSPSETHGRFHELQGLYAAIHASHALVEFAPTGEVLGANANFLRIFGYTVEEARELHYRALYSACERRGQWRQCVTGCADADLRHRF
jgi:hypothetical protein